MGPNHVKRPCNAFILFRSHAVATNLIPKEVERDHRNISRIISHMWRSLSPGERKTWEERAEVEKARHRLQHPDYKYRPSTRRGNISRRNVRRLSSTERQCENIADSILRSCGRDGVKRSAPKAARVEGLSSVPETCAAAPERMDQYPPCASGFMPQSTETPRTCAPTLAPAPGPRMAQPRPVLRRSLSTNALLSSFAPMDRGGAVDPGFPASAPSDVSGVVAPMPPTLADGEPGQMPLLRRSSSAPPFDLSMGLFGSDWGTSFDSVCPQEPSAGYDAIQWILGTPLLSPENALFDHATPTPSLHDAIGTDLGTVEHSLDAFHLDSPRRPQPSGVASAWGLPATPVQLPPLSPPAPISTMVHMRHILAITTLLVLALAACAAAVEVAPFTSNGGGPKPGDFAYPPDGFEDEEPGTVLRSREVDIGQFGLFQVDAQGYQVLYRSSGVNESQATAAITTIIVPHHHVKDKLMLTLSPEDSASYSCRPSRALEHTGHLDFESLISRAEILTYSVYLQQGWVITAPDHEGPMSAFAAGPLEGRISLDAARATLNFKKVELKKHTKINVIGYSGGAIAAGWAAELKHSYANELNVVGWAMGGTPANLSRVIEYVDGGVAAGLIPLGMAGVINAYPELMSVAHRYATKSGQRALKWVWNHCGVLSAVPFAFQSVGSFIKGYSSIDDVPGIKTIIESLTMGMSKKHYPREPVYMFHATTDELVAYDQAIDTAKRWCEYGSRVHFVTETAPSEHIVAYILTLPWIVRFMKDRFDGKDFYDGCKFDSTPSPALDFSADIELTGDLLGALETLLGSTKRMMSRKSILKEKHELGVSF
ncbi:hypothetical protein MSPP1_004106 [Malassezia sp. CBS 17886]|nr:hypothetical protein MSPP1_004106 [Malassezia sp. CBS 17886]